MTLGQLQHIVHGWITATDAGYFDELTNMALLAEETGEVARIIARRYGQQRAKLSDDASQEALADELADMLWVLTAIANQTNIDLTEAMEKNIAKKNARDSHRFDNQSL